MNDLRNKKVRDKVYGADGSEWTVTQKDAAHYPIAIRQEDKGARITEDGRFFTWLPPQFFSEPVRVIPAQCECDFSGYQVGDEVYSAKDETHVIFDIDEAGFHVSGYQKVDSKGKFNGVQTFFHAPPHLVPSNPDAFRIPARIAERKKAVDWANVPIDTLVEILEGNDRWIKRYFAGVFASKPAFYHFGATSITVTGGEWSVIDESKIRLAKDGEGL